MGTWGDGGLGCLVCWWGAGGDSGGLAVDWRFEGSTSITRSTHAEGSGSGGYHGCLARDEAGSGSELVRGNLGWRVEAEGLVDVRMSEVLYRY